MAKEERLSTGEPKLDKLIEGGLVRGTITLICGTSGTGKSTLARQTIGAALKLGEKCMIITTNEPETAVIAVGDLMGLDYKKAVEKGQLRISEFRKIHDVIGNLKKRIDDADKYVIMLKDLRDEVKNGLDIVLIDSITSFTDIDGVQRGRIETLYNELRDLGVTSIVVGESREGHEGLTTDGVSEGMADAIIQLGRLHIGNERRRILEVIKMRLTNSNETPQRFEITKNGIKILGSG